MGTHLYVEEIDTKNDIAIHWVSVDRIEEYIITKKDELRSFLEFHRMRDESMMNIKLLELKNLKKGKKYADALIERYHWKNNCGFQNKLKQSNKFEATMHMMNFEIERHKTFSMTSEKVQDILDQFIEGKHHAYTM